MNKAELKKLEKQRMALNAKIRAADETNQAKANRKLVGKCFKYDNGYSEEERWPLYCRVIGVDGVKLHTLRFETDSRCELRINDKATEYRSLGSGWHEISKSEFDRALSEVISRVNAMQP